MYLEKIKLGSTSTTICSPVCTCSAPCMIVVWLTLAHQSPCSICSPWTKDCGVFWFVLTRWETSDGLTAALNFAVNQLLIACVRLVVALTGIEITTKLGRSFVVGHRASTSRAEHQYRFLVLFGFFPINWGHSDSNLPKLCSVSISSDQVVLFCGVILLTNV